MKSTQVLTTLVFSWAVFSSATTLAQEKDVFSNPSLAPNATIGTSDPILDGAVNYGSSGFKFSIDPKSGKPFGRRVAWNDTKIIDNAPDLMVQKLGKMTFFAPFNDGNNEPLDPNNPNSVRRYSDADMPRGGIIPVQMNSLGGYMCPVEGYKKWYYEDQISVGQTLCVRTRHPLSKPPAAQVDSYGVIKIKEIRADGIIFQYAIEEGTKSYGPQPPPEPVIRADRANPVTGGVGPSPEAVFTSK